MAQNESGQGTGKHSHKSAAEPYPHTKDEPESKGNSGESASKQSASKGGSGESDDMKSREYTDAQGNVHHHTKAYMEQHGGKQ